MSIIYKTTNLVNGKIYIGQHYTSADDGYFGSGLKIKKAIKKYGKEKFIRETIDFCTSATVDEKEIYWIDKLDATDPKVGYNIVKGGQNGLGFGKSHPMFGKKHNKESKDKMSLNNKRIWLNIKRPDQSIRMKGENNPFYKSKIFKGENNPFYGKKHNKKSKDKISLVNKNKLTKQNNPKNKYIFELSNYKDYWEFFTSNERRYINSKFKRKNINEGEIIFKEILIKRRLK